jgi:hypothetical protein
MIFKNNARGESPEIPIPAEKIRNADPVWYTYIADFRRKMNAFLFAMISVILLYSSSEIVPCSKRYRFR